MRDDFLSATIEQLAKRVGYRCSNPGCRRHTSGPRDDAEKSINIGVAAHITAASAGGARYDKSLTPAARLSIENGIWLCQDCGKLVDNDAQRYTVEVLRDWKTRAEELALLELEQPTPPQHEPTLIIPSAISAASWLSYVSRSTTFAGRTEEMRLLESFLGAPEKFSWWIVTGPAGAGKSRLELELCQAVQGAWHAGFLSRADSFNDESLGRRSNHTRNNRLCCCRAVEASYSYSQLASPIIPSPDRFEYSRRDRMRVLVAGLHARRMLFRKRSHGLFAVRTSYSPC